MTISERYPDPWTADIEVRASRFDGPTPAINDVRKTDDYCPIHMFQKISVPRDVGGLYDGPAFKCPLKSCNR